MKNRNCAYFNRPAFAVFCLLAGLVFLAAGCTQLLGKPEKQDGAKGEVVISITTSDGTAQAVLSPARTMLAADPEFTRYELYVSPAGGDEELTFSSGVPSFQIPLAAGTYNITAAGFTGEKPTAKTWDLETKAIVSTPVTVTPGPQSIGPLVLKPYMEDEIYGTLQYSLSWDTVGQIPARAELLIEQHNGDDTWDPLPISLMNESVTTGSGRGVIVLLQRETGLVKQTGSLSLPPGEYRLTTSVAMDSPYPPVSRTDIAHIFSNLITPAAFSYGAGDLIVTNPGTDTGSGFITRFNFAQTPSAVSIIGSNPSQDGARLIMVQVPSGTNLTSLRPVVECAPGARVVSPPPQADTGPDGEPLWDTGDYSKPTSWIAEGRNGVVQQYTVVVTQQAEDACMIADLAFREINELSAPVIDQGSNLYDDGTILVMVPYGTPNELTPVFSYIGTKVTIDPEGNNRVTRISVPGIEVWVHAQNGAKKKYTVTISPASNSEKEITNFVFDGYPDCPGTISSTPGITVTLPYGTSLTNLKPLITYKGKSLSPASGVEQNFSVPGNIKYTVTADDGSTITYPVTVDTKTGNTDARIFDFVITNVPKAKVVIGTKPRADGKIPIVVQVPYKTSPLTDDGTKTDLKKLIPKITLSSNDSSISPNPNGTTDVIPFNNQNDYQEAVYTVTAEAGNTQDYVVVAARDVQYYYVKATGDDTDPDQYNGGSESTPFKTLAHAVYQAVKHNVDHIYVIGTLNDTSEGGAYEDTSATDTGTGGTFRANGPAPTTGGGGSVFNLNGTGREGNAPYRIYITGIGSNATLRGGNNKRVISITGGAHITFENIAIQDGGGSGYAGNGGGMYIGGDSTVIWKSGSISNNTAVSGGGVYVDNSEFDFLAGTISGNTARGTTATGFTTNNLSIQGGGGVYVNGDGLFWLAEGTIANNTAKGGSGGGVLVIGSAIPNKPTSENTPHNFIMSAGTISGNVSTGSVWPHGGGGVFVAKGVFEMLNGQITNNESTRQGGGVFVWSRSLFYADGDSSITNNSGVGSAKAICSRGITTMRGNAQADKVYVWNYSKGSWNNGFGDEFTIMEGARINGLVLAFADDPQDNRNYLNIVGSDRLDWIDGHAQFFTPGTLPITTLDLESHLTATGAFDTKATIAGDWRGKYMIKNGGQEIPAAQAADILKRFPLGSFTYGGNTQSLSAYKLDTTGKLVNK
jgi:hypothetical protein